MSNYKPIDSKREEFRKYLERAGVMDALTKALVSLYEETEKPADALDYVRKALGDNRPDDGEIQALKAQLEEYMAEVQLLKDENATLKEKLLAYEPASDAPDEPPAEEPPADEPPAEDGAEEA